METGITTQQNGYKTYRFTLTTSSIVAMVSTVRNDRGRQLPAVRLIELIVCNFYRMSSNVYVFNFC